MTMTGMQKKIANRFMQMTINTHVTKEYFEKKIHPTTEQVMQDISSKKLIVLMQYGYTKEEIATMIDDVITRKLAEARKRIN